MDKRINRIAGRQFNRVSRAQLRQAGLNEDAIDHRVARGELVIVEHGVLAIPPVLDHDRWGYWMGATLTHPASVLSHVSSAVAQEMLSYEPPLISVTRPGRGGPRVHGGVIVHRSGTLEGDVTTLRDIPITTAERTLVDISPIVSPNALARAVREAVRLKYVTLTDLGHALGRFRGRRGVSRLASTIGSYSGLPLERARSGAEVRALQVLRNAGRPMPRLNVDVAGEEADLSWPAWRLIVEIDGGPFHQDEGADARKERVWREAGWVVRRLPSDDVYDRPWRLLDRAAPPNVHFSPL